MAATLADSGELTYVSFPISKMETNEDGDLVVYGKASDGALDHDMQIVDPQFTSAGIRKWLDTGGNLRVQHNAQRDPAGIGLEAHTDADGATWVKSLVVEPVAKKLVAKGALRAYSVGIARPTIVRDTLAKGGRITAGEIVELSLVDRPANARCGIQLVKSASDGTPEYVGEVFGADADIAKALGADVTKAVPADDGFVNVDLPRDASISISPADFARLHTFKQQLVTKATGGVAEKRDFDPGVGGGVDRDKLPASSFAGPHRSFPVVNQSDVSDAMHLAGHADDPDQVRANVKRIANREGLSVPDDSDSKSKGAEGVVEQVAEKAEAEPETTAAADAVIAGLCKKYGWTPEQVAGMPAEAVTALLAVEKEAEPDVTKDPEPKDKPVKKAKKKPKKLPPWLNKPKEGDDSDDSCKEAHAHTEKCHTTPAEAAGLSGTHDMTCAPVPELLESPPVASTKGGPTPASASGAVAEHMNPAAPHREPDGAPMEAFEKDAKITDGDAEKPSRLEAATMKAVPGDPEVAVLLRFKAIGVDEDLGRLHDLTCPAYHPEDVAKFHPYADLRSLIDSGAWQKKTLAAAAGPLENALKMQEVWQAALLLKTADMADLNDWRLELHKAFRDANPGPASYPTPGMVMPGPYCRPVLTDGRADNAVDYAGPNTSPQVATGAPNAQHFDRPPLSSAQESPSPSFMKGGMEYPSEQGVPVQLTYAQMQKEQARQALVRMHDHLSRQFPEACPMSLDAPAQQPERHPVPQAAGIGKAIDPEPAPAQPVAAAFKATPEDDGDFFTDAEVYKGFKKMRKKLGKKVLSGSMTVDEARARLGRQFAQKGAGEEQEPVQKSATPPLILPADEFALVKAVAPVVAAMDPEVIKAAVAEATSDLKDLLIKQQETFTTKLAEQQRVIDAIADQPDPSTAAFSGLAFNPVQKSARPAGVTDVAEAAERAQAMIRRNLQSTYYNHSSPAVREAAGQELSKLGWENPVT